MENRKNTGLRKRKLPNDGTVQEEPDIKKMCQALKEIESELQNLRDDNSQLQNLKVMYQALKEIESELQNLWDDNSQLRDELLEKDRELAETRTLLVDREHKLSNTQALLVDREQQLAAQTLVVDTESCAAYRPPLRVIHTPARVGAVTTPLRPTNIPAPGKPKPVLRSTTGATGAQLQRSKVPGSILLRSTMGATGAQLQRSKVPGSILLREENQSMQVCLIKQMEELKQKRDQETLMLNMLEEDREAMGEAAEAITSLVNQLDASCEEIEDEGIKGPKTEIDLKRSMRQLVLSFLKTASMEELQTFKGIGEKRARMILELRELSPEIFASVENVLYSIEMKKPQVSNMMWDMMVGP